MSRFGPWGHGGNAKVKALHLALCQQRHALISLRTDLTGFNYMYKYIMLFPQLKEASKWRLLGLYITA